MPRRPSSQRRMGSGLLAIGILAIVALLTAGCLYSGIYNVAADVPHTRPVFWALKVLRDRSIAVHAKGISPPADLMSAPHVLAGAGLYTGMCTGCHLAPGMDKTELSQGLYPQAPVLSVQQDLTPAEQFWIIKHGVKLSAMPAWGKTHSDTLIWDMVAFLQKLPPMSPAQYRAIVAQAPADHDEMMKDG